MKMMSLALCIFVALTGANAVQSEVTPVQKVITLLESMLAKGKAEKHDEMVAFAAYKQFCEDNIATKEKQVQDGEMQIEHLKAKIEKLGSDIDLLTDDIAGLEKDIAGWEADEKTATAVRTSENAEYKELHKDLSESVFALSHAIDTLKKQDYDRKQKTGALMQVKDLKSIPEDSKRVITGFLAQDADLLDVAAGAPEADAYEFQSGPIIDMMEKLLDKFKVEKNTVETNERNSLQAYEMLTDDLKNQISSAKTIVSEKTATKTKKMQQKASAEADLADTTALKNADAKYLADLKAECTEKSDDYEARQALRTDELQTIEKAIGIISGDVTTAAKSLPGFLQRQKKSALAQLRSDSVSKQEEIRIKLLQYLREQAKSLDSRVLEQIAAHALDSPFQKVKKMIKDLLVRLTGEAVDEAEHKGWCDSELATNLQTRKEMSHGVEVLTSEIEELETIISTLTEKIAELTKDVADLTTAMAKATKLRQAEKAENTVTIADAIDGQAAVAQALEVLKEFYTKAGEATQFVQRQPERYKDSPLPFGDEPYKGMQAEKGGVIGFLEVIQSDFARLEVETKAEEQTAQTAYDKYMLDSQKNKGEYEAELKHLEEKKHDDSQSLETKKLDLSETQKQLDAALAYFEKLKPSCVVSPVSYEERVARRKAEMQSLQEALKILNGDDI